jgi:hypothetical protein
MLCNISASQCKQLVIRWDTFIYFIKDFFVFFKIFFCSRFFFAQDFFFSKQSQAKLIKSKQSQAKPSKAKQSQAKPSKPKQSKAKRSRLFNKLQTGSFFGSVFLQI